MPPFILFYIFVFFCFPLWGSNTLAFCSEPNLGVSTGIYTGFSKSHWFKLKRSRVRLLPPNLNVAGYLAYCTSVHLPTNDFAAKKQCSLNNTLYQCLKNIYSYNMVLLLLTTSPYKMSLHTLLRFFFFMFNNSILSLQKASNKLTRWSYKMNWHLKTLTKWTLEHLQLCLLGALLENALGGGGPL